MHVRIVDGAHVDVLVGALGYCGIADAKGTSVSGVQLPAGSEPALLATLLRMSTCTARIKPGDAVGAHMMELRCWDGAGVELVTQVHLKRTDASPLVSEALEGLFSATSALEAVLGAVEAERAGVDVDAPAHEGAVLVKGADVSAHVVYRRIVAGDMRRCGNRAYLLAHRASELRSELCAEREQRVQRERAARKIKRERRITAKHKLTQHGGSTIADFFDDAPSVKKKEELLDAVQKDVCEKGAEKLPPSVVKQEIELVCDTPIKTNPVPSGQVTVRKEKDATEIPNLSQRPFVKRKKKRRFV